MKVANEDTEIEKLQKASRWQISSSPPSHSQTGRVLALCPRILTESLGGEFIKGLTIGNHCLFQLGCTPSGNPKLKEYSRERVPLDWANAQNNLSFALLRAERGDWKRHAERFC
jgi:hypothetical protein